VSGRCEQEWRALAAAARWGAADAEEIALVADRVRGGDGAAWVREWTASGGAPWAAAERNRSGSTYLRAASYYTAALALIEESDGRVDEDRLWARQRECWDRAVAAAGCELLSIPYERTTLPGYFFLAGDGARPLVVIDHGGRVATSEAWAAGGAAARARGYHWMTFDGPGRQPALRRRGLLLPPDWEHVLRQVLDVMLARPDVDREHVGVIGLEHVGVIGLEHAGYGIPRGGWDVSTADRRSRCTTWRIGCANFGSARSSTGSPHR
jgi:hypothetical protein